MAVRFASVLCAALVGGSAYAQLPEYRDHTADFTALTEGVKALPRVGVPCNIVVGGPDAYCLVAGGAGGHYYAVVAAASYGRGLVVTFGHDGYLAKAGLSADSVRLIKNAVGHLQKQQRQTRVAVYNNKDAATALTGEGLLVKEFAGVDWTKDLAFYDAVVSNAVVLGNYNDLLNLRKFIQNGGVFVSAQNGWGWKQIYGPRGQQLPQNNHHNFVIQPAGLTYGDTYMGGLAPVNPAFIPLTNCQVAMLGLIAERDRTKRATPQQMEQWSDLLINAVKNLHPFDQAVRTRLDAVVEFVGDAIVPTPQKPLRSNEPWNRIALFMRHWDMQQVAADEITADPSARVFPGLAPRSASTTTRDVAIDGSRPGWASTGIWVNAGERVTVTVPDALKAKGLVVQIGSHTDQLWALTAWNRHPQIVRTFAVTALDTKARSEFGGLVYIVVPPAGGLGRFQVKIDGGVRAPRFVLGTTSDTYWKEERTHPGPWAELETGKIVITVPSSAIRELDDPEALMKQWDRVMDCYAELGRVPLGLRPERIVCDVQISAGYMHSGYPIMVQMDQPANLVSIHKQPLGKTENWGFWHELGHNKQHPDWTFNGTGEVTNNVFAMYVLDRVYQAPYKEAGRYDKAKLDKYLADGAKFATWQADPFLALMMYIQLVDGFGWDAYRKVFEEYALLKPVERPRNDDQKRDQWMVRFSRAVGRNLGPFFRKWGVPVSQEALDSVSALPIWMHPDLR